MGKAVNNNRGTTLGGAVRHWPTPRQCEAEGGIIKDAQYENGSFFRINKKGERFGIKLRDAVSLWPTPNASDNRDRGNMENEYIKRRIKLNKQIGLSTQVKEKAGPGVLNPDWVEWLMGWPIGWSNIKRLKDDTILNWSRDPADIDVIPRLTKISKNRKNRLMALGNGQVPACVVKAFQILSKGVNK